MQAEEIQRLAPEALATYLDQSMDMSTPAPLDIEGVGRVHVCGRPVHGRLLLAHGAGAGPDSGFMQALFKALASQGVQSLGIEFAYMTRVRREGRRRPPPRVDALCDELRVWRGVLPDSTWLGGKSMGGRVASMVAAVDGAPGLALCGYPFHPPGRPERLRLDHWPRLTCPTLVLQGTRDPFGQRAEVESYALPASARVCFLDDGEHDFKPRRASGRQQGDLISEAAGLIRQAMAASAASPNG